MFSQQFFRTSNKKQHKAKTISRQMLVVVMICCLMINGVSNCSLVNDHKEDNLLVVKNNKIVQIAYYNDLSNDIIDGQQQQQGLSKSSIKITNNQQTFKIEILANTLSNNQQQTIKFLQQHLPNLSQLLIKKGYVKPIEGVSKAGQQQQRQFVKGYKYTKPLSYQSSSSTNQEILINDEINNLLKMLIKQNNLAYLNLRLEDSFQMQFVTIKNSTQSKITYININYLFPTIDHLTIPQTILSTLTIKQHQQHLSTNHKQTLQRRLSGKGLHQFINFTLIFDDKTDIQLQSIRQNCVFQFTDILPQTTYVDVDQRREEIQNYQVINVEKPAFDSKQYYYQYTVELKEFKEIGVNKYLYQQPIHFRYPQPSLLNYTKVYLHPIEQARIICKERSSTLLQSNDQLIEKIYVIQENKLFDRGTAKLPNADISKQKIVSIVTLAVCLVTVLMIVSKLKKF